MGYSRGYLTQVELLLQVLPVINKQDCFALKGGTAINLFFRNMPRLSVDSVPRGTKEFAYIN
ncbi:nucleotidyl transferase AbiEii/AbiGii toxin family protein [Aquicella lusitana]|uniref:Nucleotidyltransferase AbiEii toxin of type IV toxin-antitoxin system n=1 Tax=Aquicella lusitana TaxID=254246 RepID=A0A370G4H8_9COXI|nr:nucleotidyltransferase AbiEii toxin of type IV toxin-antitoxin system [Aquicella lusitana]VVC74709.1 hypothetical protein AQULUS_24750 [Aquicella lusitana]